MGDSRPESVSTANPRGVLLPWEVGPRRRELPETVWDGGPLPDEDVLAGVGLVVLPYRFASSALAPLAACPNLLAVQTLTAGIEHVLPHLPVGVTLSNAAGVHDASTAELALTLILASLRGVPAFVEARSSRRWAHHQTRSLADRRVLVIGAGGVGSAIARRLAPFECSVTMLARTARVATPPLEPAVLGMDRCAAAVAEADVVVLAVPLTESTHHLVDEQFLAGLPDGALVVNVARGAVVDTEALLAELHTGRITAALDVTEPEPPPPEHPLWTVPGLLLSPHVGGNTTAFRPRADALIEAQLARWAAEEPLAHVVAVGRGS